MSHINTVALSGRTTRDPEYVEMPSGQNLAKFGLAVERNWLNKETQERVGKTSFFNVEIWGPFADVIFAKVRKGDALTLTGRLEQDTWVDKDTSQNREKVKIVADQIDGEALFRKADGSDTPARDSGISQPEQHAQQPLPNTTTNQPPPQSQPSSQNQSGDDGIPF